LLRNLVVSIYLIIFKGANRSMGMPVSNQGYGRDSGVQREKPSDMVIITNVRKK
jgi:hypothetical protein